MFAVREGKSVNCFAYLTISRAYYAVNGAATIAIRPRSQAIPMSITMTNLWLFVPSSANGGPDKRNGAASDCESDDDGEEGDYTVYECPGLAPVGFASFRDQFNRSDGIVFMTFVEKVKRLSCPNILTTFFL